MGKNRRAIKHNKLLLRTVFSLFGLRMANAIVAQAAQLQACRRARRS